MPYYDHYYPEFASLRETVNEILQREDALAGRIAAVGKDALADCDKATLKIAELIRYDFWLQNGACLFPVFKGSDDCTAGFTWYDRECPLYKTLWMMRNIVLFHTLAQKAITKKVIFRIFYPFCLLCSQFYFCVARYRGVIYAQIWQTSLLN